MAETVPLESLCEKIVDCEHKTAPEALAGEEYGYAVGTPHIRKGRILLKDAKPVSRTTYDLWTTREVPRSGDLILAREAPVGEVGRIRPDQKICLGQRTVLLRPDPRRVDPAYLHYLLLSPQSQAVMHAKASGSTVAHLNVKDIRNLPVPTLPTLSRQRQIAGILEALDDKIAVNDRIAATTDQYCAALFEDIVAGNANGATELRYVAAINTKTVKPGENDSLRYVDISSVGDGTLTWPGCTPWNEAPGRARRGISVGDTLWSTVRPNRRSRTLVLDEDPLLVASTGFAVLTPRGAGPAFLYESARRDEFVAYLESVAEGSAYPAVRAEKFLAAPIIDIAEEHRERFEALAWPTRLRTHSATKESRVLAAIRDTLLPELMSGRLRVKDAEKAVEETV